VRNGKQHAPGIHVTGSLSKWLNYHCCRFQGRRNTMIVFMFRPSPQVPEPSLRAAQRCYEASVFNVAMQREQIATGSVDLTWIFTQSLFMAVNTILWSLSYPEIRKEHPLEEVQGHLDVALEAIALAAERWPGVESALRLYKSLITACLKAYESDESFVVHSPSNHPTPSSGQDAPTPSISSPSSTTTTSFHSSQHTRSADRSLSDAFSDGLSSGTISRGQSADPPLHFPQVSASSAAAAEPSHVAQVLQGSPEPHPQQSSPQTVQQPSYSSQSYGPPATSYPGLQFDPTTPYNAFPSVVPGLPGWDPNFTVASTTASHLAYADASFDSMFWLGSIGEEYSQYSNQPYPVAPWRGRTLSQQEQLELMASLEENIPDVSAQLVNDSATLYRS